MDDVNRARQLMMLEYYLAAKQDRPKSGRYKLPDSETVGAVVFLRTRCLTWGEIAKHFKPKKISKAQMERCFWGETLQDPANRAIVHKVVHQMGAAELDGTDWHKRYSNNPYGKRAAK